MNIEHFALNVTDPAAFVRWYGEHLGLRIVRQNGNAYFIADDGGHGVLEIYHNPDAGVPDYAGMDPMQVHLAFSSADLQKDYARLLKAGATPAGAAPKPGDEFGIFTLRDPWGFSIQIARRAEPLVKH